MLCPLLPPDEVPCSDVKLAEDLERIQVAHVAAEMLVTVGVVDRG